MTPAPVRDDATDRPNHAGAEALAKLASALAAQGASEERVERWRRADLALHERTTAPPPGSEPGELCEALGIHPAAAEVLEEHRVRGSARLLERLTQADDPLRPGQYLPGLGESLAERIHDALGIEELAELERALCDGRAESLPGLGPRRLDDLRALLARVLGRPLRACSDSDGPTLDELLELDGEYDRKRPSLPRVDGCGAPVLHMPLGGRYFTAVGEAKPGRDDALIVFAEDPAGLRQWTIVTARFGSFAGRRVVRGLERECREHHLSRGR